MHRLRRGAVSLRGKRDNLSGNQPVALQPSFRARPTRRAPNSGAESAGPGHTSGLQRRPWASRRSSFSASERVAAQPSVSPICTVPDSNPSRNSSARWANVGAPVPSCGPRWPTGSTHVVHKTSTPAVLGLDVSAALPHPAVHFFALPYEPDRRVSERPRLVGEVEAVGSDLARQRPLAAAQVVGDRSEAAGDRLVPGAPRAVVAVLIHAVPLSAGTPLPSVSRTPWRPSTCPPTSTPASEGQRGGRRPSENRSEAEARSDP